MKILLLQADFSGCGFYRVTEPARCVREAGLADPVVDDGLDAEMHNGVVAKVMIDADVVVVQRPMKPELLGAVRALKKQGVKVVIELDDDIERVPPSSSAYYNVHPAHSAENWQVLKQACQEADSVVVSTPALMRYAPGGRGKVVRNRVPRRILDIPHVGGRGVGWSGTAKVHKDDLQEMRGALYDVQLHVVGEAEGVKEALGLRLPPTETGWFDGVDDYYTHVAELDVGIAPLVDTAFNIAKSYLKIMEFSALGVPWVASPSYEYLYFKSDANLGFLAKKPRDWRRHVQALMSDADLQQELGAQLRDYVRQRHVIEDAAQKWVDAWTLPLR